MESACDCKFSMIYKPYKHYACSINNITTEPEIKLSIPQGNHLVGYSDNDVTQISILSDKMEYMPTGLGKLFPNLKKLLLNRCGLKRITKNDLIGMQNLETISISDNPIKYIPRDLFKNTSNLREIIIIAFKEFPLIEEDFIDGLEKLQNLKFSILFSGKENSFKIHRESVKKDLYDIKSYIINRLPTYDEKKEYEEEGKRLEEIVKKRSRTNSVIRKTEEKSKAFESLLESDRFSDMKIIIEDETFKVHKLVIGTQSSVLADIFENNEDVKELNLKEIKKETFKIILNFIYKDELPAADANYLDLYSACGQLNIVELMQICEERVEVEERNVTQVVAAANKFGSEKLKEEALEVVQKMFSDFIVSKKLIENFEDLKKFLEMTKSLKITLEKYSSEAI